MRRGAEADLVLMGLVLDGRMDGIDAARAIQERLRIPIVFLTAHADDDTVRRAQSLGPAGYLLKPFHDQELHTVIQRILTARQQSVEPP